MDKHTATPWMVVENDGAYVKHGYFARFRIDTALGSGRDVAVALVITDTPELDNVDNAAFIVRAVNCHDELVAALKAADQFITNGIELGFIRMPDPGTPDPAHKTPGLIRDALRLLERGA